MKLVGDEQGYPSPVSSVGVNRILNNILTYSLLLMTDCGLLLEVGYSQQQNYVNSL